MNEASKLLLTQQQSTEFARSRIISFTTFHQRKPVCTLRAAALILAYF
jgi:hypothetical protein